MQRICDANRTNKDHVANMIMKWIKAKGIEVVVYEPALRQETFFNSQVIADFDEFKMVSDVIVANRLVTELADVRKRVYTRDLFSRD